MEQLRLFEDLIAANNIWDAHTVGKNLYSKDLGNKDIFSKYFDFTCTIANYPIEIKTRKYFISEAETALVFYSENAEMSTEQLLFIKACRDKLIKTSNAIMELEQEIISKHNDKLVADNNELLTELVDYKNKLLSAKKQEDFDALLIKINEKENTLIKDALTNDQKALYDTLTKEYSVIISDKMMELNLLSNTEYNRTAVKDFKHVFDEFRENEAKYKNSQSQLFTLVSKRLFSYDPAKLFNETLIYYNHVYSFVFSKLDDEGKFRLTQISIDTEKIKR